MRPKRSRRDYTFLHALGLYHVGEALEHAQAEEEAYQPEPIECQVGRRPGAWISNLVRRLFRRGSGSGQCGNHG